MEVVAKIAIGEVSSGKGWRSTLLFSRPFRMLARPGSLTDFRRYLWVSVFSQIGILTFGEASN